jgi:FKBP-type peptidyl-prolyl cis-trans isomerase SlyD
MAMVAIGKDRAVALDYVLKIDDGVVVDASSKGDPIWYLHGHGNLVPGLEAGIEGMKAGESRVVVVEPQDGYGERQDERVHTVPKTSFPAGSEFQMGTMITATSPEGHQVPGKIVGVEPKTVTVDFNHELAGKTLTFEITVNDVREAHPEELSHGHVHGPGGHHH